MQAYYATSKDEMKLQQVPKPKIEHGTDVLVEIHAVATNPVDSKAMHKNPRARTLGYDASGVILEIGSEVKGFRVGDAVFYAGNLSRDGSFAEFQVVDSRLIAHKPSSVSHDEAAAFPLVSLTAWEALHENMKVQSGESILIFPGGGGIGSIAIQLAKLAGLKVITSASRAETADWAKKLGADVVVDHIKGLENEFKAHGLKPVKYIFNAHALASLPQFVNIIAPRGHIVCITGDAEIKTDTIGPFFIKRVTISFEMMFSRSVIGYEQEEQGKILVQISKLIDEKKLQPIAQQRFNGLQQIVEAEKAQDSGKTIGKIVLLVK